MIELAGPRPSDRLLDIATGGGNVARAFAPHVGAVLATDLTPAMLAAAAASLRSQGLTNVEFAEADAEDLPFAAGSFEIVTCRIAPHHFPRPDRFVTEVARVLAPGGRFLLVDSTVPAGPVGDFWNRFEKTRDGSHVRSLTSEQWLGLIHDAGLDARAVEDHPKRHLFADWVDRADVPAADRAALETALRDSPPAVRAAFQIELVGERVVAFTDVKTLFCAVKPT
jgi:SAM-dependent methyltransferase